MEGDWYSIKLKGGKTAYVAGWIVTIEGNAEQIQRPGVEKYLKDKTIVIDPGHGGRDSGTIGVGTEHREKPDDSNGRIAAGQTSGGRS